MNGDQFDSRFGLTDSDTFLAFGDGAPAVFDVIELQVDHFDQGFGDVVSGDSGPKVAKPVG